MKRWLKPVSGLIEHLATTPGEHVSPSAHTQNGIFSSLWNIAFGHACHGYLPSFSLFIAKWVIEFAKLLLNETQSSDWTDHTKCPQMDILQHYACGFLIRGWGLSFISSFSHVVLSLISPAEWYKLLYLRKSRACWLFNFKDIFSYMVKNKQFSEADHENQM